MTSPSNMLWDLLIAQPHDEESIMQCLYDHPDCCSLVIDDKLAIHVAIEQGLSVDIIKQMLICYPACCSRKNSDGYLILHQLLFNRSTVISSDILFLIIDCNIEAVRTVDNYGNLPLYLECTNHCRSDVIMKLIDIYPDAIDLSNQYGDYTFHDVLTKKNITSKVILHLISSYPGVCRRVTSSGRLALHIECMYNCRYDVVIKLLVIYPEAVSIVDKRDCYPLHDALTSDQTSTEIIMHLISLHPGAVRCINIIGDHPLHIECKHHCRYDVIAILLDVYPEAISNANATGNLPLHIVLLRWHRPPIQVIQLLLDRYPDAVMVADHSSWLPVYRIFDKYHYHYLAPSPSYSSQLSIQYKDVMLSMISRYPILVNDHHITTCMNNIHVDDKPLAYRLMLLIFYDHLQHQDHDIDTHYSSYVDMNKKYRYPLLYLILQLSLLPSTQQVSYGMIHGHGHTCMLDSVICKVLLYMMSAVGKWMTDRSSDDYDHDGDCGRRFGWMKGDDQGSMLLRKVIYFL